MPQRSNRRGDVVASGVVGTAIYWPANDPTHPTQLVDVNGRPVTYLFGVAMNDRREIVSTQAVYRGCCNGSNALFWKTPASRPTRLPGNRLAEANGINDGGIVAGDVSGTRAARWVRGIPQILPHPGMPGTFATAINHRGAIAGGAFTPNGPPEDIRAVLWPQTGPPRVLAPSSFADALNKKNEVVGQGAQGGPAWMWRDGQVSDLQNPPSDYPVTTTVPTAINDHADITGAAFTTNPFSVLPEAVLWHAGTAYRLQDLLTKPTRLYLTQALAINNAGWIVAAAYNGAVPFNGVVLLRPSK
jgi:hypothetical protein